MLKILVMVVIMQFQHTQARVGEPGCVGVEVDVLYNDWQVVAGPPRDPDTHQRVLLLGHHHHLKHTHRVGQREVKMLKKGSRESFNLYKWFGVFS